MTLPLRKVTVERQSPFPAAPSTDPLEEFLTRLDHVRKCGKGYIARCPGHEDRTASLSITAGDDGRVLLNCFGGCSLADVVAAAGMSVADLFVRRPTSEMSPTERRALREKGQFAQWRAALNALGFESKIVQIVARDVLAGGTPSEANCDRLVHACQLIDGAREVLCERGT